MTPHALDNPIWSSAIGAHAHLSLRNSSAVRYKPEVSPFAAMESYDRESFDHLRGVVAENEVVALFTGFDVEVPEGWTVLTKVDRADGARRTSGKTRRKGQDPSSVGCRRA